MQLPLFLPDSSWKPPRIADLPDWKNAKRIAIDVETNDPQLRILGPGVRRGAYIAGISFAIEDSNHAHYLPLRHQGGDNMEDPSAALKWLKDQAQTFTGEVVGANLSYDLDFLWSAGINFPNIKRYRDIQIFEAMLNDLAFSYSLETISNKYLGIGKDEMVLRQAAADYGIDPKKDLHLLPARFVGAYAEADAILPLQILRRQEKDAEEQDVFKIYDMESDLLPVMVRMRQRGIRVDLAHLEKIELWSAEEERKALAEIKYLTNYQIPFNGVWTASNLVGPLESIGCKIPLTPKTKKPSIDKNFLNSIDNPVAEAIKRARRVNKVRTTFVNSIREHAVKDRIHCTYHQTRSSDEEDDESKGEGVGARYGRCSATNPNMQQQPIRDPEIGPMWRSTFIAEEDEEFASADFSSQEPRQAVHYATTTKLGFIKVKTPRGPVQVDADQSAREMAEKYNSDIRTDPHQALANIIMGREATKEERFNAKTIFLGLSYGMGGAKLCRSLGLPTMMAVYDTVNYYTVAADSEEGKMAIAQGGRVFEAAGPQGQELLDKFDASVPFVRALNKICQKAANKYGYIRTQSGRKCRFYKDDMGNIVDSHKSMNRIIQGSAADQTKISLIALDREGMFITGQIHDEVLASIKNKEEGTMIVEIMRNAYKLNVPNKIDLEVGRSWGEAK